MSCKYRVMDKCKAKGKEGSFCFGKDGCSEFKDETAAKKTEKCRSEIKDIHLSIDDVNTFADSEYSALILSWSADIGFGQLTIYKESDDDKWHADTETMCSAEDKELLRAALNKWVDEIDVN